LNSSRSLTILKSVVITMGCVLVIGMVLFVVLLFKKISDANADCPYYKKEVAVGARVEQVLDQGDKLMLLTRPKGRKQQLITIDKCSGEVVNMLNLVRGNE